jgi:phosphoribulokinase
MAERGHSLESIKASIEARKPDFDAYIGTAFLRTEHNKYLP